MSKATGTGAGGRYPDEWLVRDLWRIKQRLGRPPNSLEYCHAGRYSPKPYLDRWGSWAGALDACGLDPDHAADGRTDDDESAASDASNDATDWVAQSVQPETIADVRDALDALLARNYGDTIVIGAGDLAERAEWNAHVVGAVLRALADGEGDAAGLVLEEWSRGSSGSIKWRVRRGDGGEEVGGG